MCGKIHVEKASDQTQLILTCERCASKLGEHPISNDFPDVTTQREQRAKGLIPNEPESYYVWVLPRSSDTPLSEGPFGPMPLQRAAQFARIGATNGAHDRAVSRGVDPERRSFSVVHRYAAGTGDRLF